MYMYNKHVRTCICTSTSSQWSLFVMYVVPPRLCILCMYISENVLALKCCSHVYTTIHLKDDIRSIPYYNNKKYIQHLKSVHWILVYITLKNIMEKLRSKLEKKLYRNLLSFRVNYKIMRNTIFAVK